MKFSIVPCKRSRFDQCKRKLDILRKKRGRESMGDSLLLSVIVSLKHRNSLTAVEELDRYLLLVQDLTPEERAIAGGLCHELEKLSDKPGAFGRFIKVVIWLLDIVDILRRTVNLLIPHTARKLMGSTRYCHEGFAQTI